MDKRRGNRKKNGKYIFLPPDSINTASRRRNIEINRLNTLKQTIAELEQEAQSSKDEIHYLNQYIRNNTQIKRKSKKLSRFFHESSN